MKHLFVLLFLVGLMTLPLRAQEVEEFRLLISKSDGKPLVNARVRYTTAGKSSGGSSDGSTDARGILSLYGLEAGRTDVFLFAPGFGSCTGRFNVPKHIVKATPAARLRLVRGGDLIVRVRERAREGQPARALGSVAVTLVLLPEAKADLRTFDALPTRDGDGITEIRGLPLGRYRFLATLDGFTKQIAGASLVAGKAQSVKIELARAEFASARGQIFAGEKPAANREFVVRALSAALVSATTKVQSVEQEADRQLRLSVRQPFESDETFARVIRTDAQGRFSLYPLPVGEWKFELLRPQEKVLFIEAATVLAESAITELAPEREADIVLRLK